MVLALVVASLVGIYLFRLWYTGSFDTYRRLTTVTDLDNDADLDAVFAWRNLVEIWHNNARGHFSPANQTFPFSRRHALAIDDFNADGRAEIFIPEETGYKVWFMPSPYGHDKYNHANPAFLPLPCPYAHIKTDHLTRILILRKTGALPVDFHYHQNNLLTVIYLKGPGDEK